MLHVEQELLTISDHLSSPPEFSGVRIAQSLVFCRSLFVIFHLAIVLSVLYFMASYFPIGIPKLFVMTKEAQYSP